MEPPSYTSLERCITFYYCKSTLGVVTYIFFLSSFFLPFGFLLFILTADPVSFARFLRKRISSTTVKALSFSRSEFIILSRAARRSREDRKRIAISLWPSFYRFGIRRCLATSHKQILKTPFNMTSLCILVFQATRPCQ